MAPLDMTLDGSSSVPPYEQLRDGLAQRIAEGVLAPGDRLPTVRALAGELGIAANTVARAYRELEASGLIETRGRLGTVVAAGDGIPATAHAAAGQYATAASGLGLTLQQAQDLVAQHWPST